MKLDVMMPIGQLRIVYGMLARLMRGLALFCSGGAVFHTWNIEWLTYLFIFGAIMASFAYAYICFVKLKEAV